MNKNNNAMYKKVRGRGKKSAMIQPDFKSGCNGEGASNNNMEERETYGIKTPKKFEEAKAKFQESLQRFQNYTEEYESSSEDENENKNEILQKLLSTYAESNDLGDNICNELGRTQQYLTDAFKSGASVCLICIATIRKTEAIWSCESCYGIFHLPCIQKWAKDSIFHQEQSAQDDPNKTNFTWFCPKCRCEYSQSQKPTKYFCFCGKEVDPVCDPWLIPHTCGQKCDKPLKPKCGHICRLLCHPGPCPPCPQTVKVTCYCGAAKPQTRRCSAKDWSCGNLCKSILSCGQHKCNEVCHPGSCAPCPRQSYQECQCQKSKELRPCASPIWQCDKVCGLPLDCNHHYCECICHSGSCGPCPRSGERSCPCGKTKFTLPCTENIQTCGDTCGRLLECGVHQCSSRCHFGSCGTCLQMKMKRCRCGHREKSVPCHKDFRCDTKCKEIRDCGRHQCNRKCCDGDCPPCEQPCGRTLGCRNHKCNSRCHQGPCYPCPLNVEVKCNCGASITVVPCGREKTTKPPKCFQFCTKPPICHHPSCKPHRCHFGSCPPCTLICMKSLPNCDHKCPQQCHSAVLVKIVTEKKRIGPWEPTPIPETKIVDQPCPPCQFPISITCIGQHETSDFACSEVRPYSCGKQCGRSLACGNHLCSLVCHKVEFSSSPTTAGENCEECLKPCEKPRPTSCPHKCLSVCHPQPCAPCNQMIKIRCHCQLNNLFVECNKWTTSSDEEKNEIMSCKNYCPKMMSCNHHCPKLCHSEDCLDSKFCKKKLAIRCPCKRIKKEVPCHLSTNVVIECDSVCEEIKSLELKAKEEKEQRKKEEESKKEKEEMERYLQKASGKKRKQRKNKTVIEEEPFHIKHLSKIILVSIIIVVTSVFSYFLLKK